MFKYPSPWQVLCSSLERRDQVPENGEDGSPTFSNLENAENTVEEYVTAFHIEGLSTIPHGELEATAKSIPALQETNINAQSDEAYVPKEQEANLTDSQSTITESTMDRVTRRLYSTFSSSQSINGSQQDLANLSEETQATENVDKKKDVWVSPPDRRLKVLREEERFEIRSHLPEMSPTKLFVDNDSDDGNDYNVRPQSRELTPEKVLELEKKRKDIIKKQGQRKSLDTEDAISISGQNVSNWELPGGEDGQNKLNINTDQIHFESARQQFIKLEKERNSLPIMPRPQPRRSGKSKVNTRSLSESYQIKEYEDWEGKPLKDECTVTQETPGKDMNSNLLRKQFFKSFSLDIVDNGEQEKSAEEIEEQRESIPNPGDETPIEKEIRLALQREESLRKERGIQSVGETKEIIEFSKNPVLANSPDIPHSKNMKNRPRTSLFMQREIEKEVQREADLKSEGRVAGLYDKGDSQELDERRKFFEQPDEVPVLPLQGSSSRTVTKTDGNIEADISQADLVTDNGTKNWTYLDSSQPYSVRMKWKPTPFTAYRNRRLSSDNILDIKTPLEKSSENKSSEETFVLRKENFHIQPLKFGLNVQESEGKVETDSKIGLREKYTRLRPSLSNIIEQEIQQTLERDRELQEERRKVGLPPLSLQEDSELTPHNGCDIQGTSSLTSNASNTLSSAPWQGTLGNKFSSNDSTTVQIFKPHEYSKFEVSDSDGDRLKRHENRYAGIDQSDAVNTEIPQCSNDH
ncbi:mitotic interactor and substrate of PLK1 isoform X2 [Hyla sarda]|uniref:mitotic interactor and substrate of PLK1 isoform X2 n=1 Tax=Hyla sarda TaxID=327740 RepID=UPI0024C3C656|nr:mitotic interactor and substrate of PLK1 isoform X2 [Hyla sarda]